MNENLDLCKILEGCEGMEFYYSPLGINMKLESLKTKLNSFPIMFSSKKLDNPILLTRGGRVGNNEDFPNAECVIFPSKDQRDWKYFIKPIPFEAPMMCRNKNISWFLAPYSGKMENGRHFVKHKEFGTVFDDDYDYMIPYDKFDPNNIEESLKYNIQK